MKKYLVALCLLSLQSIALAYEEEEIFCPQMDTSVTTSVSAVYQQHPTEGWQGNTSGGGGWSTKPSRVWPSGDRSFQLDCVRQHVCNDPNTALEGCQTITKIASDYDSCSIKADGSAFLCVREAKVKIRFPFGSSL